MSSLAFAEPATLAVVAAVAWALAVGLTTPWGVSLPRAPEADVGAWPLPSPAALRARHLMGVAFWCRVAGTVLPLLLLATPPVGRLLVRLAPAGSERSWPVSALVIVVVYVCRLPGSALQFVAGSLQLGMAHEWHRWRRHWLRGVVGKAFVGSAVLSTIVNDLYDDPRGGWLEVLGLAALAAGGAVVFGSLVVGARLRNVAPPDARLDGLVRELLPRTGITVPLRVDVGSVRGVEPGGLTWGLRRPRVLIEAQWAAALPSYALSGLLAHEVAHAVRWHIPRMMLRYALLVVTVALGTVAAASDPTLRGWASAGPVADVRTAPLALAAGGLLVLLTRAVELAADRHQEAEADLLARQWTPDGAEAILAHLAVVQRLPPRWSLRDRLLRAQHPDTVDRLGGRPVAPLELAEPPPAGQLTE